MRRALVSLSCCAVAAALVAPPQQRTTRTELHAESKYWNYDGVDVHYTLEPAGSNAVVVFGPGFGAGAFQFEDVCRHVAEGGVDAIAMDWLGQGKSWPEGNMAGRNFGVETWISQLTAFIEQLDYSQVYVAGNSIGGLVAASVAARSDRVAGCALLNPTPFWSFWGVNGCPLWGGDLPGPAPFEAFGRAWFDALRDEKTVQSLLRQVYASPSRADQHLARDICESASHPNGPRVFASILFAGRAKDEFDDVMRRLGEKDLETYLVYGKEDPWVRPIWGQRASRRFAEGGRVAPYYELSPAGHCVHHEAPGAVAACVLNLIRGVDVPASVREDHGPTVAIEARGAAAPRGLLERVASKAWG